MAGGAVRVTAIDDIRVGDSALRGELVEADGGATPDTDSGARVGLRAAAGPLWATDPSKRKAVAGACAVPFAAADCALATASAAEVPGAGEFRPSHGRGASMGDGVAACRAWATADAV